MSSAASSSPRAAPITSAGSPPPPGSSTARSTSTPPAANNPGQNPRRENSGRRVKQPADAHERGGHRGVAGADALRAGDVAVDQPGGQRAVPGNLRQRKVATRVELPHRVDHLGGTRKEPPRQVVTAAFEARPEHL